MKVFILAGLAVSLCVGCVSGPTAVIDPNQRFDLDDLSLLPPGSVSWSVAAQSPSVIRFTKRTGFGGQHTVIALAQVVSADEFFQTSRAVDHIPDIEALEKFVERLVGSDFSMPRYSERSVDVERALVAGRHVVRVTFNVADTDVPYDPSVEFTMEGQTLYEFWGVSYDLIVMSGCSQRYRKGLPALEIEPECERFLESIQPISDRHRH